MKSLFIICLSFFALGREKIIVTGSSTIAPLLSDIAKVYERSHLDTRIDVQTGGSSRGVNDARKELSQIGMVSRSLKPAEEDLQKFTIAKDGISIILNSSNKIDKISFENIRKIYLGEIKNWKELGGDDQQIVVVNKAEGRSTLELFVQFFNLKNSEIKADVIIGDNEQGIKTVSRNRFAIGYVSIGTAEYNQSVGVPIKLLPMKGIVASVQNVANGSYPLSRELNLVTKMKPVGNIRDFIKFATSENVSDLIREHYFVPISTK
ncbi:phosphate ABC transporter substrate-binding protein [Bacteriovorax sp. Seq25_V]|uniref:phosphate ABC transporter substrate-binding protein n=1 Tax=Bacteriovorax sp. Seq25_V TaxID=1201288 RepID=UPI00038A51F9|nr:phosphate ABC transporter substrate-binding protein [Bacteriovorax sp. Seq25_V]EQC47134.1 PBP family protein [Bacteriovorax sp. Seq25_V]